MCYIDAMIFKGLAIFVLLLAAVHGTAQVPPPATAHPGTQPGTHSGTTQPSAPASANTAPGPAKNDCNGAPCEDQQPRMIVTLPAPAPATWPMHERVKWAAYMVLAVVGYAGIVLSVSTLKKIERQTRVAEAAVAAAAETAHAALLYAQTNANAERPWILVTAEPMRGVENSFDITATNRGRTPATITTASDRILFAVDESHLAEGSELTRPESGARFVPITLLPGESATLKTFRRDEVKSLCGSDEQFARIEVWEERLFLCGKVVYNDLIAPAGKETHETNWCLWYIHGKLRSALVPAGEAEFNLHS